MNRWGFEETATLLDLCIEQKVQEQMDGKKYRLKEVFCKVTHELNSSGYEREVNQVIIKYNKLKARYFNIKQKHAKSGAGKIYFPFMEKLDVIFSCRPRVAYSMHCGVESTAGKNFTQNESEENDTPDDVTNESNLEEGQRNALTQETKGRGGRTSYAKALENAVELWGAVQSNLQEKYMQEQEKLIHQQQAFEERMQKQEQEFLQNLLSNVIQREVGEPQYYYYNSNE